ncbi:MAG: hypothetical protein H6673_12015 [Anaerolineales bacterium]|nr:hypothetical protein [Anaerolineales bacterium]
MSDDLIYEPKNTGSLRALTFGLVALLALLGGIVLGALYARDVSPVVEQNIRPDQLREADQQDYILAIALDYAQQQDLDRTYDLLAEVDPRRDPFQIAADTACSIVRAGRIQTSADIDAVRHLISIFEFQPDVEVSCDLNVFATSIPPTIITPTPSVTVPPSPTPVATKTPTPQPIDLTPQVPTVERPTPQTGEFEVLQTSQFCNPNNSGVIEIRVREANTGNEISGVQVMVFWNTSRGREEQVFYTGLKPNRGEGYADFTMSAGLIYQVTIPGRSDTTDRLEAVPCDADGTLRSYQVLFQSQ